MNKCKERHNFNTYNLKIGEEVLYDNQKAIIMAFNDEVMCEVEIENTKLIEQPKPTFINKIYSFFGVKLDTETIHYQYRTTIPCTIFKLRPINY